MRVIAGKYRGVPLDAPKGLDTRPTLDRVKEALFNILQFHILDQVVLDLFSGSGGLGIEALSRGAKSVTFNDTHPIARQTILKNLQKLSNCHNFDIYALDALTLIATVSAVYDVVLIDPPYQYQEADYSAIISELITHQRLAPKSILVIECERKNQGFLFPGFLKKTYTYGNKCLLVLQRQI